MYFFNSKIKCDARIELKNICASVFLPRNYSNDRQVTCPLRKFVVWVKEDRQTMRKPEDEKANVDHEQCLGQFDCPSPVSKMKQQGLPLTDIGWPLIPTWLTNYIHDKMGMKLLLHSQTSMVQYFTGHVLSHTCWDQIHVSKTGTICLANPKSLTRIYRGKRELYRVTGFNIIDAQQESRNGFLDVSESINVYRRFPPNEWWFHLNFLFLFVWA